MRRRTPFFPDRPRLLMLTSYSPILAGLASAFAAAVAAVDAGTHRIPNRLTVTMAAIGLGLNFVLAGAHAALGALSGGLLMLMIFVPLFLAGGFGAGDVKALAAIGLLLGPRGALAAAAGTLMAGAVGGLVVLLARGGGGALLALLQRWSLRGYALMTIGQAARFPPPAGDAAGYRFPYGFAIACGTAAAVLWS